MSVQSTVRAAIVTALGTVSNVGQVHNRPRLAVYGDDFADQFTTSVSGVSQVRGWWVTWDGIPSLGPFATFNAVDEVYVFTAHGVLGVDDSADTEATFCDLVESVKAALRARANFGSSAVIVNSAEVTVPVVTLQMFGPVLCHYAEIRVAVQVAESVTFTAG